MVFSMVNESFLSDMNFQFRLLGTPVEPNEAAALLTATKGANRKPFDIELSSLLDFKTVDSKKLFDLAVENNNQDLASLAWKVSVNQKQSQPQFQHHVETPKKLKPVVVSQNDTSVDDLIDKMLRSTAYPFVGGAMLLKAASDKEWVTLRETALTLATTMWERFEVPPGSKFFRGLALQDGKFTTLDLSAGVPRRLTFHVSPLYISLREGLLFCLREGLVEQRRMLSTGCKDKEKVVSTSIAQMQRMYYKVRLTAKGKQLCSRWGDIDAYIERQFKAQMG